MRKLQRYVGDIFLLVHHLGTTKAKEQLYLPRIPNLPSSTIWKKGRAVGTQSLPRTTWYKRAAVVLH